MKIKLTFNILTNLGNTEVKKVFNRVCSDVVVGRSSGSR